MNKKLIFVHILAICILFGQHSFKVSYSYYNPFSENEKSSKLSNLENKGNGIYTELSMDFGNFKYYNEMCASQSEYQMRRGGGKKVFGLFGFSNQGYIKFNKKVLNQYHEILFGRAYIDHGHGISGRLLISKWSRPFDQIAWKMEYKELTGSMYVIQLNTMNHFKRFLAIHNLTYQISKNIQLSLGESILYAGEKRGLEFQYINPTLLWIPIRENNPLSERGNSIIYSGIKIKNKKMDIWYEFILDDYQIDKEIKEPATYGIITGLSIKNLLKTLENFSLEYTRIPNRTYQTQGEFGQENYIHRNFPIGHYFGNDFDKTFISMDFLNFKIKDFEISPMLNLSYLRDGNEGIQTEWDSPWINDQNYKESFLTPPVSYIFESELTARIKFNRSTFFEIGIFSKREETLNVEKLNHSLFCRYNFTVGNKFNY